MTPEDAGDGEKLAPDPAEIAEYAGGEVRTYRGRVNRWLIVVYAILLLWSAYYLIVHWGGLGPGLAR